MSDILVTDRAYISIPDACVDDLTPPTFAGLDTLDVESRGQIRATWLAGTDTSNPVRYEIYIQASTNVGLFNTANIVAITPNLQYDIFTMPDGSFLVNGTTYYVGVRAIDALSNRDANLISSSVISTGVTVFADFYKTEGAFALNNANQLQGTLWCLKNDTLAKSTNAVMGTASYQVYDKAGNAVVGMNESGIVADSNGQYKISVVSSSLNPYLDHYMVKVDITVDGAVRSGYVSLIQKAPEYEIEGVFSNSNEEFKGSFWITADEQIRTTGLGTASYTVYDSNGVAVPSLTQSGISADAQGLFKITPVSTALSDFTDLYQVKVTISADGINRSDFIEIRSKENDYDIGGAMSIDGNADLQGSFYITDNEQIRTTGLGTASYTVYDAAGVAVIGMNESGIVADANGIFKITPVASAISQDVSLYSVKVTIIVDGTARSSYIPLRGKVPAYECLGVFSINASNQFEATLWAIADGEIKLGSEIGTASYTVYDVNGSAVAGLTESGIVADVNGRFQITPVSAILLTDLTHYTVKIEIEIDGINRVSYTGFTLLGT